MPGYKRHCYSRGENQLPVHHNSVSRLGYLGLCENNNNNYYYYYYYYKIILKYKKDLTIEIQRMWNVKTKVIPVIIGGTGTISKSFRKYVSNIPGNHEVKELRKTAILGTAHILRKVLT